MERKSDLFGKKRGYLWAVAFPVFLFVFTGNTSTKAEVAQGITVPNGYGATVVSNAAWGLRYNDLTFSQWGEMIVPVVSSTRIPCDSFIAEISPEGQVNRFAEICVDNPMHAAFSTQNNDLLYFLEGSGYWDDLYTVPSYGTSADVRFLTSGFVLTTDMVFGRDGSLYVADIYNGTITKIAPNGMKSIFASRFTNSQTDYANRYNASLGLEIDPAGNLLVSDSIRHMIYRISPVGQTTVFTNAVPFPATMAYGPDGNLYVADIAEGKIYSVSRDGSATIFASGLVQELQIAFGPDGALYVLEWMNPGMVFGPTRIVRIGKTVIEAVVDVKPDTINLRSSGNFITCYIELPDDFSVADIEVSSVAVTAVNGIAVPVPMQATGPSEIGDYDSDGVMDLMVKFDRSDVMTALVPGSNELSVSGRTTGGLGLKGADSVRRIINRQR